MKHEEFSEVLRCYGDAAYRMAFHLTHRDEALARDLVQETFLKIWKHWDCQKPSSFHGWMYRVLHNLYIDHLRKKMRESLVSFDAPRAPDQANFAELCPDHLPHSLEFMEKEEAKGALREALGRLPPDFRIPIILCDIEGLSYAEISRIVSCPIGTTRSRIHRGRCLLRAALITQEEVVP